MKAILIVSAASLVLTAGTLAADVDKPRAESGLTAVNSSLEKASDLIGKKVENSEGENLGKIEDVVFDGSSGRISYAVLSFGGFLGLGDKLFAIPWTSLSGSADAKTFRLNLDKARLKDAPGFDKNNWPSFSNPEWSRDIDRFYASPVASAEALSLPLEIKEGAVYRYTVSNHPEVKAEPARPGQVASRPVTDITLRVLKSSAGTAMIEVTGSGTPESKCTISVGRDGMVARTAGEKDADTARTDDAHAAHVQMQLQHIFGHGLHNAMLIPGKTYTMAGSLATLKSAPDAPQTSTAGSHGMRYQGTSTVDGRKVAVFAIEKESDRAAIAPAAARTEGDVVDNRGTTESGRIAESKGGRATYRVADGLLEELVFAGTTVRRSE